MLSAETPKKLFLLDAYALIYRAYFAFSKNPRVNSKGQNTSAAFGFTNVLIDVIKNEKPTHLAVVFDPPGGSAHRQEEFVAYKAHREEMPEDIRSMIHPIKQIVEAFNVPILEVPGYEADDVVGTVAKMAEKRGFTTYMMTPDKDYAQLVSENIFMFKPGRGGNPPEILGVKEVREKFEVERPEQVIDILGLWGDASDNIPGIPGIGEKTAKTLIAKYGSVENLIDHAHELKGKQQENVINFAEQGRISKMLATIICDVDVEFKEEELIMCDVNTEKVLDIFTELEFRTLAKRVISTVPPSEIDVVIPIPESSRPSATQLAHLLGVPYREGFVKNRYVGRTFIMPGQGVRKKSVRQKLNVIGSEFKDRNVLLVDDSIVRGTTSREIVQMARDAGARKVYMASAAPPVRFPNVYGIDMPTPEELVAHNRTIDEVRELIGCDALIYQDVDAMKQAVRSAVASGAAHLDGFDASCFDGVYVTGDVSAQDIVRLNEKRVGSEEGAEDNSRLALPNASE